MPTTTLVHTPTATNALAEADLFASFRLINDRHWQRIIYFAAEPVIMVKLERFGQITPTKEHGVYELSVHPLVDFWKLLDALRKIDGMRLNHREP